MRALAALLHGLGDDQVRGRRILALARVALPEVDLDWRSQAHAFVVEAAVRALGRQAAGPVVKQAQVFIADVVDHADPDKQAQLLDTLALAVARTGWYQRATAPAKAIEDPHHRIRALCRVAITAADHGDHTTAATITAAAETAATPLRPQDLRVRCLRHVVDACTACHDRRGRSARHRAERAALSIKDGLHRRAVTAILTTSAALTVPTSPFATRSGDPAATEPPSRDTVIARLTTGDWVSALVPLARVDPDAFRAIAARLTT
ncbi:hypothetical protein V5P93_003653 [Actinokineospora auranticolor]|uniref:Uncharacterized protein n=1 Tax=Actinokineospora auranticolor TaxID=155976 RepID=A0A2S6GJ17_9PSEU|nr:hypothetical protein [Actinokineospora auranticolor]PPK65215.1 hypothetical protein CLV40_11562 [Actinokineospora auranticolor]